MHACMVEGSFATVDWAPPAWMDSAACRGHTALFFGPSGEQWNARPIREAATREICLACPVLESCRRWAREHREYGFWGGETEEERAAAGYCVALPTGRQVRAMRRRWNEAVAAGESGQRRGA